MTANATAISGSDCVHWATLRETDSGYTHEALCGAEGHGYTVFRGVTCGECIAIANDDAPELAKYGREPRRAA